MTPVKNAANVLGVYADNLDKLTYPRENLSLGILESDSNDGSWSTIESLRPRWEARCRRVVTVKRDYGFHMPPNVPRWQPAFQLARRNVLARSRNQLLFRALADEDWVLWLDVDVIQYPADLISRLLDVGRDIVHPHCVKRPGGETFDLNAWSLQGSGTKIMSDFRGAPGPVRLDAVGGTVLLVRADLHRDGLVFPPFRYGVQSAISARSIRSGVPARLKLKGSASWRRTWATSAGACPAWRSFTLRNEYRSAAACQVNSTLTARSAPVPIGWRSLLPNKAAIVPQ